MNGDTREAIKTEIGKMLWLAGIGSKAGGRKAAESIVDRLDNWGVLRDPGTPMVWVSVEGGIADSGVAYGDAKIVQWDWDNIRETTDPGEIEDAIEEAEQLPRTHAQKADILANMRKALDALREVVREDGPPPDLNPEGDPTRNGAFG